ncbi:hypothetical protein ACWDVV_16110, partial [Streptomyces tendae]
MPYFTRSIGWETARVVRGRLIAAAVAGDDIAYVAVGEAQLLMEAALRGADWDTARARDIVAPFTQELSLVLLTRLNREVRTTAQAARERVNSAYPDAPRGTRSPSWPAAPTWRPCAGPDWSSTA